mgnify:CR=1 FL=1
MKLIYETEKLKTLIIKTVQKTLSMDLVWEWPCGVAYYGVLKAYHAVKEEDDTVCCNTPSPKRIAFCFKYSSFDSTISKNMDSFVIL